MSKLEENSKSNEALRLLSGEVPERAISIGTAYDSSHESFKTDTKSLEKRFPILEALNPISPKQQFFLIPVHDIFALINSQGECLVRNDLDLKFGSCDHAAHLKLIPKTVPECLTP